MELLVEVGVVLEWVEVEVEAVHEWEPMELLVEVEAVLECLDMVVVVESSMGN
jgi:hypothetical protein